MKAVALAIIAVAASTLAEQQSTPAGQARPGQPTVPQAAPSAAPARPSAVLRGRVTALETGAPIVRARVTVAGSSGAERRSTTTDASGAWELARLPAGRYTVSAAKTPYFSMFFGQRTALEPGKPIELADGQVIEKVDFALPRGGVIAGRILDDLGDPAAFTSVNALRSQFIDGSRQLVRSVGTLTDDLGQFRLYGLPAGTYYVSTQTTTWSSSLPEDAGVSFASTFYPGTTQASEAQAVKLAAGQERAGVDFRLVATRLAGVSGSVLNADGSPAAGALVMLSQGGRPGGGSLSPTATDAAGRWRAGNLAPGTYEATAMGTARRGNTAEAFQGAIVFTVNGRDLDDLVIAATPGARISGVIEFEDATPPDKPPSGLRAIAQGGGEVSLSRFPGDSRVHDDWTFELLSIWPGDRVIRLSGLPAGYALKSSFVAGDDAIDTPRRFKGTEDIGGVRLVVTSRVTELSGGVADDRGRPVKDYSLLVFSTEASRWNAGSRYRDWVRPDQNGRFRVIALPPGEYYAIALPYLSAGDQDDPEFLEELRDRATKILLAEGSTKTIELKLSAQPSGR